MSTTAPLNPIYDLSILSTDFVPDGTQTSLLVDQTTDVQKLLNLKNKELQGLQYRVQELRDRIDVLEGTLKLNEALLSPSRRLSPETLGEVFMHCLPVDSAVTMTPSLAPLLLTHVSRRWRRVACGTPHLWQKLYLGRGFSHQLHTLVPLWLTNSGALPIDIRTSVQDWQFVSNHRRMEQDLVRLFRPSIYRCRSLVGSMSPAAVGILFDGDLLMPYLENLELWSHVWTPTVEPSMSLGSLQTPRLRNINLNDTGFVTNALRGPLPSVQHLQLTGQETFGLLSHSRCLDFIALCPNLRSCTLTLSKDPGTPLHPPIRLKSLCHLHLIFQFSPHDPVPFLMALHMPCIQRLTLQNHGGVSPVPHIRRVLNMLLSVRPHTIKELNVSSLFVPTSDWVPSLCELTELTGLSIIGDSLDEDFFKSLTAEDPLVPWKCPKLTFLKLHHVTGLLGSSGDRLVAFIRSRAPLDPHVLVDGCNHLSKVSLVLCDMENRHKEELQDIERECNGALHLYGLDPTTSGSGSTYDFISPWSSSLTGLDGDLTIV